MHVAYDETTCINYYFTLNAQQRTKLEAENLQTQTDKATKINMTHR